MARTRKQKEREALDWAKAHGFKDTPEMRRKGVQRAQKNRTKRRNSR